MATRDEDGRASNNKFISKDSRTLGGQRISTHSTMLLSLLGTVAAWQVTTMTKLVLVVEVWVGGRGTFHGCVTNPKLMMIPKGIYFGLWRDLWELMIPKIIYFGLLGADVPQENLFWVIRRFMGVDNLQENLFWVVKEFRISIWWWSQENSFCVMRRFMGDHDPQQNRL